MEILKLATEWAKAEIFSTRFFIFFCDWIFNRKCWILAIRENRFSKGVYHSNFSGRYITFDNW